MSSEQAGADGEQRRRPRQRSGPLGLVAFLSTLWSVARKQLQSEKPTVVARSKRVSDLQQLGRQLAADGREDQAAVAQLRALARDDRTRLLQAAAAVRLEGYVTEDLITFRTNELLQAAAAERPVRPVTAEQGAWFERLDQFLAGSSEAVFERARQMQPALGTLEAAVLDAAGNPEVSIVGTEAWCAIRARVDRELAPLVGPKAAASDPLLRARSVHDAVRRHLLRIAYGMTA